MFYLRLAQSSPENIGHRGVTSKMTGIAVPRETKQPPTCELFPRLKMLGLPDWPHARKAIIAA